MQVFKDLWSYVFLQKKLLLISVLSLLLYALTNIFPAIYIKNVIDNLEKSSHIPPLRFLWFALALLVLFSIRGITFVFQKYFINKIIHTALSSLRKRMFNQLSKLPLSYFDIHKEGDIISYFSNDLRAIERSLIILITNPIRDSFQFIALLGIMLTRSWSLFLVIVLMLPVAPIVLSYFNKKNRKISRQKQNQFSLLTRHFNEVLQAVPIIRSFNAENFEKKEFKKNNRILYQLCFKAFRVLAFSMSFLEMIWALYALVVVLYGGYLIIHTKITVGDFISFILSFFLIVEPIKNMNGFMLKFEDGISASNRIQTFLEEKPEEEGNDTEVQPNLPMLQKQIDIQIDSFSYKNEEEQKSKEVLKNIKMTLKMGETIALVGLSGSGKTTIGNLIPRFYKLNPEEGRILFDGNDIAKFNLHSLREQITIVTQENIIFNDTIWNNISYSKAESTLEEVEKAAKMAYINEFVASLPEGYNTRVVEHGNRLSGGQKQRIVIARALLQDSPILILDEATSALDQRSEVVVQKALANLTQGKTCLIIAHRLSTICQADKIYVLKQGEIKEKGTHEELLANNNEYAKLYKFI